jgi:hypothetical protein
MRARRAPVAVPSVAGWTTESLVSLAQAVALIAARDKRKLDDERTARDRARKLLGRHIVGGSLSYADAGRRLLRVGQLVRFLREHFPGKFNDLPGDIAVATGGALSTAAGAATVSDLTLPGDLPRCHQAIRRLGARVAELETTLAASAEQIANLEPDAQRWREFVASRRRSARKPRTRRS